MSTFVAELAAVYRKELALYNQVFDLVQKERRSLKEGRPLCEIIDSFKCKRNILGVIESMELTVAAEKARYKRTKSVIDPGDTGELNETIRAIKNVIQDILRVEDENERTVISHSELPNSCDSDKAVMGGGVDAG